MPKTLLDKYRASPTTFQTAILGNMALRNIKYADIPGGSESTYRRKMKAPGSLTIEDIAHLFSALKIEDSEQERLLLALFNTYKER